MASYTYPTKDATIDSDAPDLNLGSDSVIFCYNTGTRNTEGLMDLPLPDVDIRDVVDFTLMLYAGKNPSDTGGELRIHQLTGTFDDTTVTWNNAPGYYRPGYINTNTIGTSSYHWEYFGITNFLGMDYDGEISNYGIRLRRYDENVSYPIYWNSLDGSTKPRIRTRYLSDFGGKYVSYSSDVVLYNGKIWCATGNARIYQHDRSQTSPYTSQLSVRPPWATSYDVVIYLDEGESITYSTPISGGTEYFIVENNSTGWNREVGYYPIYKVTWYREYGIRYVRMDGDDGDTGMYHSNAWATVEKGLSGTPNGGYLYIHRGLYSETLSNLNPANGLINIIPYEYHNTTNHAAAIIGTGTVSSVGNTSGTTSSLGWGSGKRTLVDITIDPGNNVIQAVRMYLNSTSPDPANPIYIKFHHFRGTYPNYTLIDESIDWMKINPEYYTTETVLYAGFNCQSGDLIATTVSGYDNYNNSVGLYEVPSGEGGLIFTSEYNSEETIDLSTSQWTRTFKDAYPRILRAEYLYFS